MTKTNQMADDTPNIGAKPMNTPRSNPPPKDSGILPKRHQVFISYSRADSPWMDAIRQELDLLPDFQIDSWVDTRSLAPGEVINKKIEDGINSSDIAILLISKNFIKSQYIQEHELKWINNRSNTGNMTILYAMIVSQDEDSNELDDFLRASSLDTYLSATPLDSPLPANIGKLDSSERNGKVKQVVGSIRRAMDPHFSQIERDLNNSYTIQGRISESKSAVIYRARRESFGHDFAIKVLKKPDDLEWFQTALRKASNVTNTKNIIPITDHHFRSSLSYCVLKYIEGETLSSYIKNNHPLSIQFARNIIRKLGKALLQVRSETGFRLMYFDIRADNILIENDTNEPFLSLAVRPENKRGIAYLAEIAESSPDSILELSLIPPETFIPHFL